MGGVSHTVIPFVEGMRGKGKRRMNNYFAPTSEIVLRAKITDLSKTDKMNILYRLLQDLGFIEELQKNQETCECFDAMWLYLNND